MDSNIVRDYKEVCKDFTIQDPLFSGEPDKVRRVKEIVLERLDQVDQTLILMYADCGSYRALGKRLGLSHMSVKKVIDNIVNNKILPAYYEMVAKEMKSK